MIDPKYKQLASHRCEFLTCKYYNEMQENIGRAIRKNNTARFHENFIRLKLVREIFTDKLRCLNYLYDSR